MIKTDRNSAEDFCHPPGAVCTVSCPTGEIYLKVYLALQNLPNVLK